MCGVCEFSGFLSCKRRVWGLKGVRSLEGMVFRYFRLGFGGCRSQVSDSAGFGNSVRLERSRRLVFYTCKFSWRFRGVCCFRISGL